LLRAASRFRIADLNPQSFSRGSPYPQAA
jgi:hypothetical protein